MGVLGAVLALARDFRYDDYIFILYSVHINQQNVHMLSGGSAHRRVDLPGSQKPQSTVQTN